MADDDRDQAGAAEFLDALGRNREAVREAAQVIGEQVQAARTAKLRVAQQVSWKLFVFLGAILAITGTLVFVDKLDAGSFTLIVGVLIGYLMQFAEKTLFKPPGTQ